MGGEGIGGIIGEGGHDAFKSKPIADLFPDATVLFGKLEEEEAQKFDA